MIYLTGDTHGEFSRRFNKENFPEQKELTREDYVIICGDFGGIWEQQEDKHEKHWLDWFESRSYTLLFIDGNHENYDRLNAYPVREWHGGRVHEIRPHVLHLMRGQVFEIDGRKIFTFGGASSHDISAGILNPHAPDFKTVKKRLDRNGALYRIDHISWWKEELADEAEMQEGLQNLEKHHYSVDYILTHCCSTQTQQLIHPTSKPDRQTDYLQQIKDRTDYKKWFFGHYHSNQNINEKEILIYEQIIRIS